MHVRDQFKGHTGAVYALVNGPTLGVFLSGGGDGTVVRWNCAAPEEGTLIVRTDQAVFSLCLLGEDRLGIGGGNGDLRVVDMAGRTELQLLRFHRKGIFRIIVLPDHRVACAGGDGVLSIWSLPPADQPLAKLDLLRSIPLAEEKLRDLALGPDGGHLAIACGDGTVRILEARDFNELYTIAGHEGGANAVAWHPGKPVLLTGGKDGHLRFWNTDEDYRAIRAIPAHRSTIYRILFDPDGTRCITTSRDKSAKLWNADTFDPWPSGRMDKSAGGHANSVNDALWMEDDPITGGDDRRVLRWANTSPDGVYHEREVLE